VVTFHSLEDRIVKQFFASRGGRGHAVSRLLPHEVAPPPPTFALSGRQPVVPGPRECHENPRARSAKLRWAERTATPAAAKQAPPAWNKKEGR
jgi:16S rRNA (cytosine1402-N4)-methyltransferase